MLRILIAGCGYVGVELGRRLASQGHRVHGLRRDPSNLPPSILPLQADLLDPELGARLPPVDRVVYAAAAGGSTRERYRAIYHDGVRNLLEALSGPFEPTPDHFIFVSSTAVYGDAGGGWVTEDTPPAPENFRGEEVLAGEALVLDSELPGSVLRLGGIYGPGRTRLLDRVREGQAVCPGGDPIFSNRIHRDDAARALEHLLLEPVPKGVYLGVDDAPTPLCEFYRTLARILDAPEPRVDPELRRGRSNKRCRNEKLRRTGFRFRYPSFREGYEALIEGEEWRAP